MKKASELNTFRDIRNVEKATYLATTSATYQAQIGIRVAPEIINMAPADDTLRQRWAPRAKTQRERAAYYTTLDSIAFASADNNFFAEGLCPPSIEYTKTQKSKVKKHYGVEGGLTNAAIAALDGACDTQSLQGQIMTEEERNIRILEIAFRNSEDWAMINGDEGDDANAFDGLDQEISAANGSLVYNLAGSQISRSDIDNIIAIQALRGVRVSAILTNPLAVNHIKSLYYITSGLAGQPNPYSYETIPSVNGPVDLVGDSHVGVTYASGNNFTTTVYVLAETKDGDPLLYMDYLIPESILPPWAFSDGAHCTSTGYGIYAVGTLVSRANVAQSKFTNVGFSSIGSLQSTITTLSSMIV